MPAATFVRIAYFRPPAGKGIPALWLGVPALPRILAVLPLVGPSTSLPVFGVRRVADLLEAFFAVLGRERGDFALLCYFGHLLETDGRDLSANRLALVGPPNPRNRGRGRREGSGVWAVLMQLCRSFASCQDCACIGVLGIASERSQL